MDKYGLIGFPLKHSFSKRYFTEKFAIENIDAEHNNYEISSIDDFVSIISSEPTLKGLNVTIPYKEQVIQYLDELDEMARAIGAVNVIKIIRKQGKVYLKGYNSDLIGFRESISPLLKKEIHTKALVLGTGGASKAIVVALNSLGIQTTYVSRTPEVGMLAYTELPKAVMEEYKVVVNTSPVGTFPNVDEYPDIPYQYLGAEHLLYDLVYNPPLTRFLELGLKQGASIKNGANMFELQAIASWDIWKKGE
ncbi:MAG: hypothetical protein RL662_1946 [Bacteroidota bacterium]|jgi:shikimate dehydrogenase